MSPECRIGRTPRQWSSAHWCWRRAAVGNGAARKANPLITVKKEQGCCSPQQMSAWNTTCSIIKSTYVNVSVTLIILCGCFWPKENLQANISVELIADSSEITFAHVWIKSFGNKLFCKGGLNQNNRRSCRRRNTPQKWDVIMSGTLFKDSLFLVYLGSKFRVKQILHAQWCLVNW